MNKEKLKIIKEPLTINPKHPPNDEENNWELPISVNEDLRGLYNLEFFIGYQRYLTLNQLVKKIREAIIEELFYD